VTSRADGETAGLQENIQFLVLLNLGPCSFVPVCNRISSSGVYLAVLLMFQSYPSEVTNAETCTGKASEQTPQLRSFNPLKECSPNGVPRNLGVPRS
jgi:hypothetical protein